MGRWEDDVLSGNGYGYVGNYTDDEPDWDSDDTWGDDDEEAMLDDIENDDYEAD